jgi:hypothetical protein
MNSQVQKYHASSLRKIPFSKKYSSLFVITLTAFVKIQMVSMMITVAVFDITLGIHKLASLFAIGSLMTSALPFSSAYYLVTCANGLVR